jgi:hypothetical protein
MGLSLFRNGYNIFKHHLQSYRSIGMPDDVTPESNAAGWLSQITTPGARAFVEQKGYSSVDALAIAALSSDKHIASTRRMSGNAVEIPAQNATDEDWSKFFASIGRPEQPGKYDLQFGNDVQVDNGFVDWAKQGFHAAGLNPRQANALVKAYVSYAQQRGAAETSSAIQGDDAQVQQLKTSWGKAWDSNIREARKAVAALGIDARLADRLGAEHGTAATMELLARLGRAVAEGKVQLSTADDAAAKIEQLKGNKAFQDDLRNPRAPRHAERLKEWSDAHAAAYPAGPRSEAKGAAPSTVPGKPAAGSALAEIAALENDPVSRAALFDKRHPDHAAVVEKRRALYEKAYPPKKG